MRTAHQRRQASRSGFTFIEVLIVILIIAILMALLLAGLSAAQKRVTVTTAVNDISQMNTAHAVARQEYNNVSFLPSQIKLCKVQSDYGTTPLDIASQNFLFRAFGKKLWSGVDSGNPVPVHWDGNPYTRGPFTLYGDQLLTYWLGGIPSITWMGLPPSPPLTNPPPFPIVSWPPPAVPAGVTATLNGATLGFSNDATNPAWPLGISATSYNTYLTNNPGGAFGSRKGPFFGFNTGRMFVTMSLAAPQAIPQADPTFNGFYRYMDPFGWAVPYLYFSSGKAGNDYDASDFPTNWPAANPSNPNYSLYVDPASGKVAPYYNSASSNPTSTPPIMNYMNAKGFQIICAGQYGVFGPGGPFDPASGVPASAVKHGGDDLANFSGSPLGTGTN